VIYFIYLSNADAANTMILGKDMLTWMVYTLCFLGLTSLGFIGTWIFGLLKDIQSGKPIDKPWE